MDKSKSIWKLVPKEIFCVDAAARARGELLGGKAPVIRVETHPPVATSTHEGTVIRGECTLVTIHTPIGVRRMGVADAYINSALRMAVKLWPGSERDVCLQRWENTRDERPKYLKTKIVAAASKERTTSMRFVLTIELGNDAMSTDGHIATALKQAAKSILSYQDRIPEIGDSGPIRDVNGNRIGSWHVEGDNV